MTPFEPVHPFAEAHQHGDEAAQEFSFRGPWFSAREAAAYVPCKSVKAFGVWCRRHGIVRRGNGSVAKRDIDSALRLRARRRTRRGQHPNSRANLVRKQGT